VNEGLDSIPALKAWQNRP